MGEKITIKEPKKNGNSKKLQKKGSPLKFALDLKSGFFNKLAQALAFPSLFARQ